MLTQIFEEPWATVYADLPLPRSKHEYHIFLVLTAIAETLQKAFREDRCVVWAKKHHLSKAAECFAAKLAPR